jgi:hypothetical protein
MAPALVALVLGFLSPWSAHALKQHRASDACKCRSFHQVYKSGDAKCGQGLEDGEVGQSNCGANQDEFCGDSYCILSSGHKVAWWLFQNHSRCVMSGPQGAGTSEDRMRTWCYVSPECQELNGGKIVTERVSAKFCTEADPKLGDLSPAELFTLSPWELSLTADFAYDYEGGDHDTEPDYDRVVEPSGHYKSGCKRGKATRLTDGGEQAVNVVCKQGQEKWFINDGIAECVRGCPAGSKMGAFDSERDSFRWPRREAWMYGEAGPREEDEIQAQEESNSFELTN